MREQRAILLSAASLGVLALAILFGLPLLVPRRAPAPIDLSAVAVSAARATIAYRASHGSFSGADSGRVMIPLPVGVGVEFSVIESGVTIEARGNGQRCLVRVRATDTVPARPEC